MQKGSPTNSLTNVICQEADLKATNEIRFTWRRISKKHGNFRVP